MSEEVIPRTALTLSSPQRRARVQLAALIRALTTHLFFKFYHWVSLKRQLCLYTCHHFKYAYCCLLADSC